MRLHRDGGAHTVQVIGIRGEAPHALPTARPGEPAEELQDADTPDELRSLLRRATAEMRAAGYEVVGEWTVNWSRCRVPLADLD